MKRHASMAVVTIVGLTAFGWIGASTAMATSGPGCFQPKNVAADDVLNVRSRPSASSSIVTTIPPEGGPIIARRGACGVWCAVSIYDGDNVYKGWIKRRFLRNSDCP